MTKRPSGEFAKVNPAMLPDNASFVLKAESPSISPADQAAFAAAAKEQKKRDSKTSQRFGLQHQGL